MCKFVLRNAMWLATRIFNCCSELPRASLLSSVRSSKELDLELICCLKVTFKDSSGIL